MMVKEILNSKVDFLVAGLPFIQLQMEFGRVKFLHFPVKIIVL